MKVSPKYVTYTRVGTNEVWSGWQIAGQTTSLSPQEKTNYLKIMGSNSGTASLEKLHEDANATEIFECITDNGQINFSKLKYGFYDDFVPIPRKCMRADGVVISNEGYEECLKNPQSFLYLSDSFFEHELDIDKKRDENSKLKISLLVEADKLTIYEKVDIDIKEEYDIDAEINHFFTDKSMYVNLIKCVYWTFDSKSWSPVYVNLKGDNREKIRFATLIFNSLIYSMRPLFSFRTYDIPESRPVRIVISDHIPNGAKYFDMENGSNNVFNDLLNKRFRKFEFVKYFAENYMNYEAKDYFSLLENQMKEFGEKESTNFNFIQVVHDFMIEELSTNSENLSKDEVLLKLRKFLTLKYNNDFIDSYILKYFQIAINEDIPLNEGYINYLKEKMKVTKYEPLIESWYDYQVIQMLKSEDPTKDFEYLYSLRNDTKLYDLLLNKIIKKVGGVSFVDAYFAEYYAKREVKDKETLISFNNITKQLGERELCANFVINKVTEFGQILVDKYFANDKIELDKKLYDYENLLSKELCLDRYTVEMRINVVKIYFWQKFSFDKFKYENAAHYKAMEYRQNNLWAYVSEIISDFDRISKKKASSVNAFKNDINDLLTKNVLENKVAASIIRMYQLECLKVCSSDKTSNLDFWYAVALLLKPVMIEFLYESGIHVLISKQYLEVELSDSDLGKDYKKLSEFRIVMEKYSEANDNCLKEEISYLKNTEKSLKKNKRTEIDEYNNNSRNKKDYSSKKEKFTDSFQEEIYSSKKYQEKASGHNRNKERRHGEKESKSTSHGLRGLFGKKKKNK